MPTKHAKSHADSGHDMNRGLGMLLCAMADDICADLSYGIRKGYLDNRMTFAHHDGNRGGRTSQDVQLAANFLASKGCARMCEWISEITGRSVEPVALAREATKRAVSGQISPHVSV